LQEPKMGRLSTHVLDTVSGKPAHDVALDLHRLLPDGTWSHVKHARTNADGRTNEPLLAGDAFKTGTYLLTVHIADYFRRAGIAMADPPYLDIVPLRFTIAEPDSHYHVPLLASPWSYSTYRGS
jgi:5-hydroxyisourate hydrolase